MYFNYHAKAKNLIKSGEAFAATLFDNYHHISPALVIYFKCYRPIPIREYMWDDYFLLLKENKIKVEDKRKL